MEGKRGDKDSGKTKGDVGREGNGLQIRCACMCAVTLEVRLPRGHGEFFNDGRAQGILHRVSVSMHLPWGSCIFSWEEKSVAPLIATPNVDKAIEEK
jgi:hypothetical protein